MHPLLARTTIFILPTVHPTLPLSINTIDSNRQHRVKMTVAGGIIEQLQLQLQGLRFSWCA